MSKAFYLSMMTVFAILFLISYFLYATTKKDLNECRLKETAYRALIDGDFDKFKSLMKDLPEHELDYYSSKFFNIELSLALEEKNSGNFGKALDILEKSLKVANTKSQVSKALILKSEILMKMERYDDVVRELRVFVKDQTLPDRERALEILKEAAKRSGDKELESEIERILKSGR